MPDQVGVDTNESFDPPFLRISYSSLTTPLRTLDMDLNDFDSKVDHKSNWCRQGVLLKEEKKGLGADGKSRFSCHIEFILVTDN